MNEREHYVTTPKSDTGVILEQVYDRLDVSIALAELEPKHAGNAYSLICPNCSKRRAFIYTGGHTIICNRRNDCGYQSSLWDYVAAKQQLTESKDILRALAELAGYELPSLAPDALEAIKRTEAKQSKLETAQGILTARLWSAEGSREREYLHSRGYSDDDIKTMALGAIPPQSALIDALKSRIAGQDATVSELSVHGYGTTHTLSIPFRNRRGQLTGWSVRSLDPEESQKYKYSVGMETGSELFNLDQCHGLTSLVIVEAPLDALIASARGIPGVVACGRNKPTDKQLDGLKALGVTTVTLALDADTAGQSGTEETIYKLADRKIASYVLTYPEGIKDLDENIKQSGADDVLTRIESAPAGYSYLIECLHSKHSKHEVMTDKEQRAVLDELIELDAKLNDDLASKAIVSYLSGRLELAPEAIKQALKDNRESKAQAERELGYQKLSAQASQLIKANKYEEAEELITETMPSLRAKNIRAIIEPYTSDHFITDLQARHEGYSTGFHELDEYALIPSEALTIVAGRPSHGKTTVMLNMLYNMVTMYPAQAFYFFSYEETRSQLALKLITLMAGIQVDQYKNTQKIEAYFKTGRLDVSYLKGMTEADAKSALNSAKEEYDHLIKTGRLWIVDEPMLVTDLTATIEELATERSNIGAVFIDYMQKIKSKYNVQSRQVEIQKISAELLDTAKRAGTAVVLGAQLNRGAERGNAQSLSLDQLRESGDIEQDAHLVLGLYNHARGAYDADPEAADNSLAATTIDVKVLKNRSGVTNKTTSVVFHAPTLKLTSNKTMDTERSII